MAFLYFDENTVAHRLRYYYTSMKDRKKGVFDLFINANENVYGRIVPD